jgi:hypothetical protein
MALEALRGQNGLLGCSGGYLWNFRFLEGLEWFSPIGNYFLKPKGPV